MNLNSIDSNINNNSNIDDSINYYNKQDNDFNQKTDLNFNNEENKLNLTYNKNKNDLTVENLPSKEKSLNNNIDKLESVIEESPYKEISPNSIIKTNKNNFKLELEYTSNMNDELITNLEKKTKVGYKDVDKITQTIENKDLSTNKINHKIQKLNTSALENKSKINYSNTDNLLVSNKKLTNNSQIQIIDDKKRLSEIKNKNNNITKDQLHKISSKSKLFSYNNIIEKPTKKQKKIFTVGDKKALIYNDAVKKSENKLRKFIVKERKKEKERINKINNEFKNRSSNKLLKSTTSPRNKNIAKSKDLSKKILNNIKPDTYSNIKNDNDYKHKLKNMINLIDSKKEKNVINSPGKIDNYNEHNFNLRFKNLNFNYYKNNLSNKKQNFIVNSNIDNNNKNNNNKLLNYNNNCKVSNSIISSDLKKTFYQKDSPERKKKRDNLFCL